MVGGGLEQRALGNQADDLAPGGRHALGLGFHLHHVEGAVDGSLLGVHEVHRDLGLPIHFEAETFHIAQTAGGSANGFGDALGHGQVLGGTEVDVVRHEEGPGADGGDAGGGVHAFGTEVGLARRDPADLVADSLELSAAHVGEVLALGARRGAFVQVDGDLEFGCGAHAKIAGKGDAVLHRGAFEGDERHDVGGAHARVFAGVLGEVDVVAGRAHAGKRGIDGPVEWGDEGDHTAIVGIV